NGVIDDALKKQRDLKPKIKTNIMSDSGDGGKKVCAVEGGNNSTRKVEERQCSREVVERLFDKLMGDEEFSSVLYTLYKERKKFINLRSQIWAGEIFSGLSNRDEVLANVSQRLDTVEQETKKTIFKALESHKMD
ncbi:unnamed protein product, partial [Arabis nemorensis]